MKGLGKLLLIFVFMLLSLGHFCTLAVAGDQARHGVWSQLLEKYVDDEGVDYRGFKEEESTLDSYLAELNGTNPDELSESEQLALYINAYNAYTVKLILKNFKENKPVSSIKRLGSFFSGPWKIQFAAIGGEKYTLDNIEHDIIRPKFKEPRVHFAVNCASKSCPPLITQAYEADTLHQQLEENTISFLNDPQFNYLEGNTLYVTKIFSWFSEDFPEGVLPFVKRYARGEMQQKLAKASGKITIKYLDYDWSLNGR